MLCNMVIERERGGKIRLLLGCTRPVCAVSAENVRVQVRVYREGVKMVVGCQMGAARMAWVIFGVFQWPPADA